MLTQLSTIKSRLFLLETDTMYDALITTAIKAVSARFDKETNRTLSRTVNATHEFDVFETEILPEAYPIETVSRFELKTSETEGWLEQANVNYLIRRNCVISLNSAFSLQPLALSQARVTYTGGFVLPGTAPAAGQTALPDDLEQAAVEQVAYWFQKRERLGIRISWPSGGTYEQYVAQDLLPGVSAVLANYRRWTL